VNVTWENMAGELALALESVLDSAIDDDTGALLVDGWKIDRANAVLNTRLRLLDGAA
jgi:hypothetical protein